MSKEKFKVIVAIECGIVVHNVEVEADCSVEAISKAGHEVCRKEGWGALAVRYFSNGYSALAQFDEWAYPDPASFLRPASAWLCPGGWLQGRG